MASPDDSNAPSERRVTTDRTQIRDWADQRDAVPATVMGGESADPEYTFVRREAVGDEYEEQTWDEFFERFEQENRVFVYHDVEPDDRGMDETETGLDFFELANRDTVMDRAALENDEVEQALREGETITTELVETRTVEREVVETDTIESELIDTNVIERDVIASELLDREVLEVEFVDDEMETESSMADEMEAESPMADEMEAEGQEQDRDAIASETIVVHVDEQRMDTVEEIEQLTVESRIVDVDVDVEERDEVDVEGFETNIADETIHRSILESDMVRSSLDADEMIDEGRINTSREGESIESQLLERRTIEEEVRDRRRLTFRLVDSEIVETEVMGGEVIEADLLDVEEYEMGAIGAGADAGGSGQMGASGENTGMGTEEGMGAEAEPGSGEGMEAGMDEGTTQEGAATVELTDDDRGKDVVDATGEQVGLVADIDEEMIYIDPEPGFADRLKARFNWGEPDQDAYPVEHTQIREVRDDEVVLESE